MKTEDTLIENEETLISSIAKLTCSAMEIGGVTVKTRGVTTKTHRVGFRFSIVNGEHHGIGSERGKHINNNTSHMVKIVGMKSVIYHHLLLPLGALAVSSFAAFCRPWSSFFGDLLALYRKDNVPLSRC